MPGRCDRDRGGIIWSGQGQRRASVKDAEAGWHVKTDSRGRNKAAFGFSVHTGVNEDGFIHRQIVTAGNVHDSQERDTPLIGDETALYADAAYSSKATRDQLRRFDIEDHVQRKGYRNHPLAEDDEARNARIAVTCSAGERPFAAYKQHYGLARTRFLGLAMNLTFLGIAAIDHNIRKAAKFVARHGLREPALTG